VACSRRLHDRLHSEDLPVMIDLYGSGSTARQITETFTVSLRSVKRLHQQRGVRRREPLFVHLPRVRVLLGAQISQLSASVLCGRAEWMAIQR
jgi:hypothetical protein